jgi:hypothetical protein
MEHYVTLFDSLFLPQGLALHMSMERHIKDYTLWILCVDDEAHEVLSKLNLPNVCLLKLSQLKTEELLGIEPTRSRGEYCWTLTPFAPRFVFEAGGPDVKRVTYLDADLWFRKHPATIFSEFEASGKHVLITDHAYAPEYDRSTTKGQYCVQFMTFTRDGGELIRKWWEERCIEWCFEKLEDGKFGDQKYLDDWPQRFADSVHVMNEKELALAPWNATRFPFGASVFYHFHGLRIVNNERVNIGLYSLPKILIKEVYQPYLVDLRGATRALAQIEFKYTSQVNTMSLFTDLYNALKSLYKVFQNSRLIGQMKW